MNKSDDIIPSIEIVPVFDAARLGYVQTRIPALIRTDAGTLIAFCEARRAPGDWSQIDIVSRRSTDGGRSWGEVQMVARSAGQGEPASNACPIVGANGTLHFLNHHTYKRILHRVSHDDGLTWSEPRDITAAAKSFRDEYNWKVFAPGPGHGIRLRNGRLLVPVWMSIPGGPGLPGGDHRPSCVATLYSDDEGETWKRGEIIMRTQSEFVNPNESTLAQLSDGRVIINSRSESLCHRRLFSISPDGIRHWSSPVFDDSLFEPVCMASLLATRDPDTGKEVLLFCNPDSRHDPRELDAVRSCSRSNGIIRLSRDGGTTWPVARVIDAGPFSYSDLAASPDGTVYCLYECGLWGNHAYHHNTHVALARFSLRWIKEGPPASFELFSAAIADAGTSGRSR